MNLVDGIEAFVKIADLGSFAAAARELNISPSAVSKLVSKTEVSFLTGMNVIVRLRFCPDNIPY